MNLGGFFGGDEQKKATEQIKKLGPIKIIAFQREWSKIIAEAKTYMKKGTDSKDPEVRKLAERWMDLVNQFAGGNMKVQPGLNNVYKQRAEELRKQFGNKVPDWDVIEYILSSLS